MSKVKNLNLDIKEEIFWEFNSDLRIGHIRADYAGGNTRLANSWRATGEATRLVKEYAIDLREVQKVVNDIMYNHYNSLDKIQEACNGDSLNDAKNFFAEYGKCNYWIRLIPAKGEYNMYIYVYPKENLGGNNCVEEN